MMSRKHYIAIASAIAREYLESRNIDERKTLKFVARNLADVCAADNSRFDRERFYLACGIEKEDWSE